MLKLEAQTVAKLRLQSLLLGSQQAKSAREVVRWFGAMQAQDLASGKWSFGVRLPHWSEADVDAAILRAEFLRTWPMRGTIHFVPAEDARWMLELTGVRALRKAAARRAYLGLDEKTVNKAADVLGNALAGNRRFTRTEAVDCLREHGIQTAGQHGYHLLWYVSQIGITCIGPNQEKEQTFVLLSDWAKKENHPAQDEALALLALRYFRSHGPASQQDFAGWSDLPAGDAKRALAMNEKKLRSCQVAGKTMWMDKDLLEKKAESTSRKPTVHVLPGFDEYLLGIKDRSIPVPAAFANQIIPGGNGMFASTMVVDGIVVGTWKRSLKRAEVEIQPSVFRPLSRSLRIAFDAAFQAYARYLGLTARVGW